MEKEEIVKIIKDIEATIKLDLCDAEKNDLVDYFLDNKYGRKEIIEHLVHKELNR